MRAPLYASTPPVWAPLVPLACLGLAGCLSGPKPEAWLAVGFRTPEQTFRTFQTGLRADLPDLEYRCLGADMKRRVGADGMALNQLLYREFRSELFRSRPWLKLAARAEVREVRELAPGRVRIVAEVDTWFHDETFEIDLVEEEFYEIWVDGERVQDDYVDLRRALKARDGGLTLTVPVEGELEAAEVGEVRVGREWKIDGFPLGEDDEGEPPRP
jgi:hypothetical protein